MTMEATAHDEKPGRVAYQGAPGAFSHEACSALHPWDEAVAFETFQAAIDALAKDGKMTGKDVARAIKLYKIDPEKANPVGV